MNALCPEIIVRMWDEDCVWVVPTTEPLVVSRSAVLELLLLGTLPRSVAELVILPYLEFSASESFLHLALWALTMHLVAHGPRKHAGYAVALGQLLHRYRESGITRLGIKPLDPGRELDIYVEFVDAARTGRRLLHCWRWRRFSSGGEPALRHMDDLRDLDAKDFLEASRLKDHNVANLALVDTIRKRKKLGKVAWFSASRSNLGHCTRVIRGVCEECRKSWPLTAAAHQQLDKIDSPRHRRGGLAYEKPL